MKSIIHYNVLLLTLFILASCGGPKNTKASFVVSRGFALVNSTYDGGLTIYGKNLSTNETFSYASLPNGGSNSIVLDLQKGNWSFSVVGWSGATAGSPLTGTPFCDHIASTSLNSDAATISLTPTSVKCAGLDFASPNMQSANMLKTMKIFACPKLTGASDTSNGFFCTTESHDIASGDKIFGIKLRLHSQPLPGTTAGAAVESSCISTSSQGYFSLTGYKIPTKNFPFHVQTYKDVDCNIPSNAYPLINGFEYNYTNFKSITINTEPMLFIASTRSRFEISPFSSLLPEVTCNTASCSIIKNLPSGFDFVISGGVNGPSQKIILSKTKGCSHFTNISVTGGILLDSECIQDEDDYAGVMVRTNAASICPSTGTICNLTYDEDGVTISTPKKILAVEDTNYAASAFKFQELLWEMLGVSQNDLPLSFSMGWGESVDKNFGILGDVREMLGPHGPGGAFNEFATCEDAVGTKYIDAYDDGVLRNFQISILNIAESIPRQICPIGYGSDGICPATFDKKIILRRPVNGIYYTTEVIKIDCQNKTGIQESHYTRNDSDGSEDEKQLLYWNNSMEELTRIEKYSYDLEKNTDGSIRSVRTEVKSINRESIAGTNKLVLRRARFESENMERIERDEIIYNVPVGSMITTSSKSFSQTGGSLTQIFIMPEFETLMNDHSNHQRDIGASNQTLVSYSPNGQYRLSLTYTPGGSNYSFKLLKGNIYKEGIGVFNYIPTIADLSINDAGKAVLVFKPSLYNSIYIKRMDLTAAVPAFDSDINTQEQTTGTTITKLKAYLGADNLISIGLIYSDGLLNYSIKDYTTGINHTSNFMPISYVFTLGSSVSDFVARHTSGNQGKICYTSSSIYMCLKVAFPTATVPTNNAIANFNFSSAFQKDTQPLTISMSGLSGSSISYYIDPGCTGSLITTPITSSSSSSSLSGLSAGLYNFYYKIDSGTCTNIGLQYYSWPAEQDNRSRSLTNPMIIGDAYYDQTNDKLVSSINSMGAIYQIKYDPSQAQPQQVTSAGITSHYSTQDLSLPADGLIDASGTINSTYLDTDQLSEPLAYPRYKNQLKDLYPNDFNLIFTNTASFTAQ